jgi:adenylate kinase
MKTIILVGIPGSGKTSILQEAMNQVPSLIIINYADRMLELSAKQGVSRDMLRKMEPHEQRKAGIEAAKTMVSQEEGVTIVDTHAMIKTPIGYMSGIPLEVLEILKPKALAWIECRSDVILQRRTHDTSRSRDNETKDEIALHQSLTRSYLAACALSTGALLCPIPNNEGSLKDNAEPLIKLIQSYNPI